MMGVYVILCVLGLAWSLGVRFFVAWIGLIPRKT